jgi:hypothetical protein
LDHPGVPLTPTPIAGSEDAHTGPLARTLGGSSTSTPALGPGIFDWRPTAVATSMLRRLLERTREIAVCWGLPPKTGAMVWRKQHHGPGTYRHVPFTTCGRGCLLAISGVCLHGSIMACNKNEERATNYIQKCRKIDDIVAIVYMMPFYKESTRASENFQAMLGIVFRRVRLFVFQLHR